MYLHLLLVWGCFVLLNFTNVLNLFQIYLRSASRRKCVQGFSHIQRSSGLLDPPAIGVDPLHESRSENLPVWHEGFRHDLSRRGIIVIQFATDNEREREREWWQRFVRVLHPSRAVLLVPPYHPHLPSAPSCHLGASRRPAPRSLLRHWAPPRPGSPLPRRHLEAFLIPASSPASALRGNVVFSFPIPSRFSLRFASQFLESLNLFFPSGNDVFVPLKVTGWQMT